LAFIAAMLRHYLTLDAQATSILRSSSGPLLTPLNHTSGLVSQYNLQMKRLVHSLLKRHSKASTNGDSKHHVDLLVVGGGIIGWSILNELSQSRRCLLVEQHAQFGWETTARNSQVIHAGIYYPKHALKTQLCIEGKELLYSIARDFGIECRNVGKWIVAVNPEEEAFLNAIKTKADELNVPTRFLAAKEMEQEPLISSSAILESPTTGIVDVHGLLAWLQAQAQNNQADAVLHTRVVGVQRIMDGFLIDMETLSGEAFQVQCNQIVNAAGLYADTIASMILNDEKYQLHYCIGRYFSHHGPRLAKRLIYPAPEHNLAGLGIHLTLDLDGRAKFGPDTLWLPDVLPSKDGVISSSVYAPPNNVEQLQKSFYQAIKRYIPSIQQHHLEFDYSGIRPKLSKPGEPPHDFVIALDCPNAVNLVGIESPGVTASLAIAKRVAGLL
jgi:2-hydroxyglutarate dehydrogenase